MKSNYFVLILFFVGMGNIVAQKSKVYTSQRYVIQKEQVAKKDSVIPAGDYLKYINTDLDLSKYVKLDLLQPNVSAYSEGASSPQVSDKLLPMHKKNFNFEYVVKNNEAIYQGDIVLGDARDVVRPRPADHPKRPNFKQLYNNNIDGIGSTDSYSLSINDESGKWFYGIMPYELDDQWSQSEKESLERSIRKLDDATNLTLVPKNGQQDYIFFKKVEGLNGGASPVGRQGRANVISLGGTWERTVIHEILHSAGLWHEQSRGDRDAHITVIKENIEEDKLHNFNLHVEDGLKIGQYDKISLMHYGGFAWGKPNGTGGRLPTIIDKSTGNPITRASTLSQGDIEGVNFLYPVDYARYATPILNSQRRLVLDVKRLEVIEGSDNCGTVEFYMDVRMGEDFWSNHEANASYKDFTSNTLEGRVLSPQWSFSHTISKGKNRAKIRMNLREEDGGFCGADDYCDINPIRNATWVDLLLYLDTGEIWIADPGSNYRRHYLGQINQEIEMEGYDSEDHEGDDTVKSLIKFKVTLQ